MRHIKPSSLFLPGLIALLLAACSTAGPTPPLPTGQPTTDVAPAATQPAPAPTQPAEATPAATAEAAATPDAAGGGEPAEATSDASSTFTFETADGVTLGGTLWGESGPGVVLAPSYPGEQAGWSSFAAEAAEAGYQVLTFDMRGYGASEGTRDLSQADEDVVAAVAALRARGAEPVVVIAAGQSGIGAIEAAAQDDALAGLALLSTPRSVGDVSLADDTLAALTVPTLWLGARTDMAQAIEELAAAAAGSDSVLWIYEGSSLSGTYLFEGADQADLRQRLLQFVARVTGS